MSYVAGRACYSQVARSHIVKAGEGLLKLLVRQSDRSVVGVHIAGEQAAELIQLAAFLLSQGPTVDAILEVPWTFPALSELYRIAALDAIAQL